jgi:hypothetical protein
MKPIGYNMGGEWLKAIYHHEGLLYGEISPLQKKIDALSEHSKNLSKLLQVIYTEKDKKPKDKKTKEKEIDFRPYPEYMDLVDKVREGSMQAHDVEQSEPRIPVIPEGTYSWKGEEIDALISALNEEAKRSGTDITPLTYRMTYAIDKGNRVTEIGNDGRRRMEKEIEHTLYNSRS